MQQQRAVLPLLYGNKAPLLLVDEAPTEGSALTTVVQAAPLVDPARNHVRFVGCVTVVEAVCFRRARNWTRDRRVSFPADFTALTRKYQFGHG